MFLFFLFLYLLTANGRIVNRDGEAMFQVAASIAERGRLDVPAESVFEVGAGPRGTGGDSLSFATETARRGVDGNLYAIYGLGQSLVSVPLYLVGKVLTAALPQVSPYFSTRFTVALLNPMVSALACAVLFSLARSLGFARRNSLVLTLLYGTATMAWPYSKSFASEPLVALMLLVSSLCLVRSQPARRTWLWLALAGASLGFAVMNRVSVVVLLPVFAVYWLAIVRGRIPTGERGLPRRHGGSEENGFSFWAAILAFFIPVILFLALIGWYDYARFGSPFVTGYQSIAWNRPIIDGLYGLLLSPGKGLLWYSPALVLSVLAFLTLYRFRKREALFIAGLGVVWVAFHAPYRFWEGGWSWGPRLMLPILPFLLLPTVAAVSSPGFLGRWGARLLAATVVLGLAVQISAVGVDYTRYLWENYSARPDEAYAVVVYQPAGSPLVQQWPALAAVVGNAMRTGELDKAREAAAESANRRDASGLSEVDMSAAVLAETQVAGLNFPDFWFVYLYVFGAPTGLILSAGLVILTGFGIMLVVLDRRLRGLKLEERG
ncbi:MAG: phospholipid carrier-dependent glycosyltransferase [Dehalococcoidia bacterium]|nr:phospholipid carrier-dependent glycosyltransferase [Dehalococcoidia bacterium]